MRIIDVQFVDVKIAQDGEYTLTFNDKVTSTIKVVDGKVDALPAELAVPYRSHKQTATEHCKLAISLTDKDGAKAEVEGKFELHYE